MFRRATSFSTAPTPPLCNSPTDDSSYEEFVIKLSVHKLESKKHTSRLRNSTLIRSVHQRALQQALTSSWEAPSRLQDYKADVRVHSPSKFTSPPSFDVPELPRADFAESEFGQTSVWDMVDAWEASRKRGEDVLMDDDVDDDVPKRLCLGLDSLDTMPDFLPSLSWDMSS